MKADDAKLAGAIECLFETLRRLNFNVSTLRNFFHYTKESYQSKIEIINCIEGGWEPKSSWNYKGEYVAGELSCYYRVDLEKFKNQNEEILGLTREYLSDQTKLLEIIFQGILSKNKSKKIASKSIGGLSIISQKKYQAHRDFIRLVIPQIIFGIDVKPDDILLFNEQLVSYWRKTLECLRVELHMMNRPTYPSDVRQADLFLKILESNK